MVIVWGQRMYGRIDKNAGTYLGTRFFHIYYLPLIPLSSWLVLEEHGGGNFTGIELKLQWRSVLAAWLRVFGTVYLVASCGILFSLGALDARTSIPLVAKLALVAGLVGFAWFRLGKLSALDRLARTAYAQFTGRVVDPGLLANRDEIKAHATAELDKHLVRHATATYRDAPQTHWKDVATHADMREIPLLCAALTRCRIEVVDAEGPARAELEQVHAKILANLAAAQPVA